jgi:uncharacterized protein
VQRKAEAMVGKLFAAVVIFAGFMDCARAQQPSFDCQRARVPVEFAICSDRRLSELDSLGAAAFEIARRRPGTSRLTSNIQSLLLARIACQSDRVCILDNFVEGFRLYQNWGIPVGIPDWVRNTGLSFPAALQVNWLNSNAGSTIPPPQQGIR